MGKWVGLSFAIAVAAACADAGETCSEDTIYLQGDWGSARFSVDVVDTPESRSKGLMFVEQLPRMSGMLFVYDQEQPVAFWMKNTLIPLDMLFISSDGSIEMIARNTVPGSLRTISPGVPVKAVLELNGGLAAELGIQPGDTVQHPIFGNVETAAE